MRIAYFCLRKTSYVSVFINLWHHLTEPVYFAHQKLVMWATYSFGIKKSLEIPSLGQVTLNGPLPRASRRAPTLARGSDQISIKPRRGGHRPAVSEIHLCDCKSVYRGMVEVLVTAARRVGTIATDTSFPPFSLLCFYSNFVYLFRSKTITAVPKRWKARENEMTKKNLRDPPRLRTGCY